MFGFLKSPTLSPRLLQLKASALFTSGAIVGETLELQR